MQIIYLFESYCGRRCSVCARPARLRLCSVVTHVAGKYSPAFISGGHCASRCRVLETWCTDHGSIACQIRGRHPSPLGHPMVPTSSNGTFRPREESIARTTSLWRKHDRAESLSKVVHAWHNETGWGVNFVLDDASHFSWSVTCPCLGTA